MIRLRATLDQDQRGTVVDMMYPLPVEAKPPPPRGSTSPSTPSLLQRLLGIVFISAVLIWMLPLMGFILLLNFPDQAHVDAWLLNHSNHFKEQRDASFSALLAIPSVLLALYGALLAIPASNLPSTASRDGSQMLAEIQDNHQRVKQREAVIFAAWLVSLTLVIYHFVGVIGSAALIRHYEWYMPASFIREIKKFAYVSWIHPNYLLAQLVLFIIILITMVEVAVPLSDKLGGELKRLQRLRKLLAVMVQLRMPPSPAGVWVSCAVIGVNLSAAISLVWMSNSVKVLVYTILVWIVAFVQYVLSLSGGTQIDAEMKILRWTVTAALLLPTLGMIEKLVDISQRISAAHLIALTSFIGLFIGTSVILGAVRPHIRKWDFAWERRWRFHTTLRRYCSEREGLVRYLTRADDALVLTLVTAQAELEKEQPTYASDYRLLLNKAVQ